MTSLQPGKPVRIIDANLNRVGEGLRVLEDLARFLLNDAGISSALKTIRHELLEVGWSLNRQLLDARDAAQDVGRDIEAPGQGRHRNLYLVAVANSRRVQESLRVIEEMTGLSGMIPALDREKFKQARFKVYTLERALLSRLARQDKAMKIKGLYITCQAGENVMEAQELTGKTASLRAGVLEIADTRNRAVALPFTRTLRALCTEHDILFIVKDALDLALAADADGLRLGKEAMPAAEARRLLPFDKLLGCEVASAEEALQAREEGADYCTLDLAIPYDAGLEAIRYTKRLAGMPVLVSGPLDVDNITDVILAGADAVALEASRLDNPEETRRIAARFIES